MTRGEVHWARVGGGRHPVVVLSMSENRVRAMMVVAPATEPIEGVAVEVRLGAFGGLPVGAVVRVALRRPDFIPCQWLVTVSKDDVMEHAGALSPEKLAEVENLLRRGGLGDALAAG